MIPAFVAASITLIVMPGPNAIYILSRSAYQGVRTGIASALGVETGTLVHVALATIGVSAFIAAEPAALTGVRLAGGAYLIYLAVRTVHQARMASRPPEAEESTGGTTPAEGPTELAASHAFWGGVLVNVTNVKVGIFFLAFLPQFVTDDANPQTQMLMLGAVFVIIALMLDLGYALAGGAARRVLRGRWMPYAAALVYSAIAAYTIGSAFA